MRQDEYWNGVAEDKNFTTPLDREAFGRWTPRDARVLDIGCGYGRILAELADIGYADLVGFDPSKNMIERGRREHPGLDLRVMEDGRVPLPDGSAGAVLLVAVLTCVVDDAAQDALLAEARRLLKPGGIVYINDFMLNDDARNLERYARHAQKYRLYGAFELPDGAVVRHHSPERAEAIVSPFETLFHERSVFETMNGNRSNGFTFVGRKLP